MYRFLKIQNFCESDDNHNEKQMDEYKDVQENIKIIKWKRRVKNVDFFSFPRVCLSLYDQSKVHKEWN